MTQESITKKRRRRSSKGCTKLKQAQRSEEFLARVFKLREKDVLKRTPDSSVTAKTVPFLGVLSQGAYDFRGMINPFVDSFYALHRGDNQYLEVRSGVNVANPLGSNGQKGVFTKCNVFAGTTLCPYVGKQKEHHGSSQYSMYLDNNSYIDAHSVEFDMGYFLYTDHQLKTQAPCPPNYGRYVNSIREDDPGQSHLYFNAVLEPDEQGFDEVWVIALTDIPAGTEVLVDYGSDFVVWL